MNFLSMLEATEAGIADILELSKKIRENDSKYADILRSKILIMLFEKSSTRTRVSFDVAMTQLGGHAISLDFSQIQTSRGETIADTAKTLSIYSDCVMARLYKQEDLIEFEKYSDKPVINGQTDEEHPSQALSDLFTMNQYGKAKKGLVFCYVGDANRNVANSIIVACAKKGMEVRIACPTEHMPNQKYIDEAKKFTNLIVTQNLEEAVSGADVLYTDRWTNGVGDERVADNASELRKYRVDEKTLAMAAQDCILMHPLPANRGIEIDSNCLDCSKSVVWEQAQNRLHVQKAMLIKALGLA